MAMSLRAARSAARSGEGSGRGGIPPQPPRRTGRAPFNPVVEGPQRPSNRRGHDPFRSSATLVPFTRCNRTRIEARSSVTRSTSTRTDRTRTPLDPKAGRRPPVPVPAEPRRARGDSLRSSRTRSRSARAPQRRPAAPEDRREGWRRRFDAIGRQTEMRGCARGGGSRALRSMDVRQTALDTGIRRHP